MMASVSTRQEDSLDYPAPACDREALILKHLPYVKRIVHRMAVHLPPSVDVDDLIHVGVIGLIQAIDRYDPTRDNKFLTYAVFRIKGAVLSELRSRDFLSRSNRRKVRHLEKTYTELEQRLGREVGDDELCEEMGLTFDELYSVKKMSSICFVTFEELGYTENDRGRLLDALLDSEMGDALTLTRVKEMKSALARAIDGLPEKEKLVISLYYHDELTMKEAGKVLNITESRVSQIHSQAIIHLRGRLRREGLLGN